MVPFLILPLGVHTQPFSPWQGCQFSLRASGRPGLLGEVRCPPHVHAENQPACSSQPSKDQPFISLSSPVKHPLLGSAGVHSCGARRPGAPSLPAGASLPLSPALRLTHEQASCSSLGAPQVLCSCFCVCRIPGIGLGAGVLLEGIDAKDGKNASTDWPEMGSETTGSLRSRLCPLKKIIVMGWGYGAAVRMPHPTSHVGCACKSQLPIQLPANVRPGRQQIMVQVLGSLPSTWGAQMEFLALAFGLAQPWLLGHLGGGPADERSVSLLCAFKIT